MEHLQDSADILNPNRIYSQFESDIDTYSEGGERAFRIRELLSLFKSELLIIKDHPLDSTVDDWAKSSKGYPKMMNSDHKKSKNFKCGVHYKEQSQLAEGNISEFRMNVAVILKNITEGYEKQSDLLQLDDYLLFLETKKQSIRNNKTEEKYYDFHQRKVKEIRRMQYAHKVKPEPDQYVGNMTKLKKDIQTLYSESKNTTQNPITPKICDYHPRGYSSHKSYGQGLSPGRCITTPNATPGMLNLGLLFRVPEGEIKFVSEGYMAFKKYQIKSIASLQQTPAATTYLEVDETISEKLPNLVSIGGMFETSFGSVIYLGCGKALENDFTLISVGGMFKNKKGNLEYIERKHWEKYFHDMKAAEAMEDQQPRKPKFTSCRIDKPEKDLTMGDIDGIYDSRTEWLGGRTMPMKDYYPIKLTSQIFPEVEPRFYPRVKFPYKTDAELMDTIPHTQKPGWNRAGVKRISKKYGVVDGNACPRDVSPFDSFSRNPLANADDSSRDQMFVEQSLAYINNDPMTVVVQKPSGFDENPRGDLTKNPEQPGEIRDKGTTFKGMQGDKDYYKVRQKPILQAQTLWKKGTYKSSHEFCMAFGINEPKILQNAVNEGEYMSSPKKQEGYITVHETSHNQD
jgi:hypothetical protein